MDEENNEEVWHGATAYAQKQADVCKGMAEGFARLWLPFLDDKEITCEWKNKYLHVVGQEAVQRMDEEKNEDNSGEDGEEGLDRVNNGLEWDD